MSRVNPGSMAATALVREGDIIHAINGVETNGLSREVGQERSKDRTNKKRGSLIYHKTSLEASIIKMALKNAASGQIYTLF